MDEPVNPLPARGRTSALSTDVPTPLYYQLYSVLRAGILEGALEYGARVPTEKELSSEYGVSRITAKRALDELAAEELVERQRGRGTHVIFRYRDAPVNAPMIGSLQEIESIGRNSSVTVIDCRMSRPPALVREALSMPPLGNALFLSRVRHRDGKPFGFYRSWTLGIHGSVDTTALQNMPRLSYFRERGLRAVSLRQHITARQAGPDASEALRVNLGSPLLSVVRKVYDQPNQSGNVIDYLQILYHPTRFEYRIDLEFDPDP